MNRIKRDLKGKRKVRCRDQKRKNFIRKDKLQKGGLLGHDTGVEKRKICYSVE